MQFSEQERDKVLRMAAEMIVAEIKSKAGCLEEVILIPVPTVARFLGMASPSVGRKFRVKEVSHRQHCVSLKQLLDYVRTSEPSGSKKGGKAS